MKQALVVTAVLIAAWPLMVLAMAVSVSVVCFHAIREVWR